MTNLMSNMFGGEGAPGGAEPEAAAAGVPPVSGGFEQILNSAQQFAMNMNSQNPDFVAQMRERMNIQSKHFN
jgi:hypothetical protein